MWWNFECDHTFSIKDDSEPCVNGIISLRVMYSVIPRVHVHVQAICCLCFLCHHCREIVTMCLEWWEERANKVGSHWEEKRNRCWIHLLIIYLLPGMSPPITKCDGVRQVSASCPAQKPPTSVDKRLLWHWDGSLRVSRRSKGKEGLGSAADLSHNI